MGIVIEFPHHQVEKRRSDYSAVVPEMIPYHFSGSARIHKLSGAIHDLTLSEFRKHVTDCEHAHQLDDKNQILHGNLPRLRVDLPQN